MACEVMIFKLESSPSQTPHVSKIPEAQHRLSSPMTPAQHLPRASTAVAFPPHTPHASSTPDGQQPPSAVMAAEAAVALALQHVASGFSTPRQQPPSLSSGPEQEGGELQVMPVHELEQLHSPLAAMQLPWPEHICPRHALHCFMLHMVVAAGCALVQ